jgi:hypothetical protein
MFNYSNDYFWTKVFPKLSLLPLLSYKTLKTIKATVSPNVLIISYLTSAKFTRFNRVSVLSTASPSFLLSSYLIKLIVIIVLDVTRGTNRS